MPALGQRKPLVKKLASKFLVGDGCWEWTGWKDRHGYGELTLEGKKRRAHRVVYELVRGPIPEGLELDHLCRNPACVRPSHLEPVMHAENVRRAFALKTHCPHGHLYDEANTYRWPNTNARKCRTCHRDRERMARR